MPTAITPEPRTTQRGAPASAASSATHAAAASAPSPTASAASAPRSPRSMASSSSSPPGFDSLPDKATKRGSEGAAKDERWQDNIATLRLHDHVETSEGEDFEAHGDYDNAGMELPTSRDAAVAAASDRRVSDGDASQAAGGSAAAANSTTNPVHVVDAPTTTPIFTVSAYQPKNATEGEITIKIPADYVGRIIGRGGATIRDLQDRTGAFVYMPKEEDATVPTRVLHIAGNASQTHFCSLLLQLRMTPREDQARINALVADLRKFQPFLITQVHVPTEHVGRVIGKGGQTIRQLQDISGASIHLPKESDPGEDFRRVTISGHPVSVQYCEQMLLVKITPREEGGTAGPGPAFPPPIFDPNAVRIHVMDEHVGRVIGKKGSHIREIQEASGATIYLPKECIPGTNVREVVISGPRDAIIKCQHMLQEKMAPPGQDPIPLMVVPTAWSHTSFHPHHMAAPPPPYRPPGMPSPPTMHHGTPGAAAVPGMVGSMHPAGHLGAPPPAGAAPPGAAAHMAHPHPAAMMYAPGPFDAGMMPYMPALPHAQGQAPPRGDHGGMHGAHHGHSHHNPYLYMPPPHHHGMPHHPHMHHPHHGQVPQHPQGPHAFQAPASPQQQPHHHQHHQQQQQQQQQQHQQQQQAYGQSPPMYRRGNNDLYIPSPPSSSLPSAYTQPVAAGPPPLAPSPPTPTGLGHGSPALASPIPPPLAPSAAAAAAAVPTGPSSSLAIPIPVTQPAQPPSSASTPPSSSAAAMAPPFAVKLSAESNIFVLQIREEQVGRLLGKGGHALRQIQEESGAIVELGPPSPGQGGQSVREVRVIGLPGQVTFCRSLIQGRLF